MKRISMGLITFMIIFFGAGQALAQKYNLTLTGASPGGLWSRLGGGIDAALAKAYPGSTVTYQTSSGGLANIPLVSSGKVPMGLATDSELKAAVSGLKPYRTPIKNVRMIFRTYESSHRFQLSHLMANKAFADKHGIRSFADIVKKKIPVRIAVNRRGNMDGDTSLALMAEMGVTAKDIESWGGQVVHAASREMTSLMLDRRIDMIFLGISFKHPRIREIAKGIETVMYDIPRSALDNVIAKLGGERCEVKASEYKSLNIEFIGDVAASLCVGNVMFVNQNMDEQLAYNITKGIFQQIEKFKTSHRLIKATATLQSMSYPTVIPFHPGAARYLREAGLLK